MNANPVLALIVFSAAQRKAASASLTTMCVLIDGKVKELYSTPGRGKLRRSAYKRVGTGRFANRKDANGTQLFTATGRKRKTIVRKGGAARSNIDQSNRASAPGDPPAPDKGTLRNSPTFEVTGLTARVGPNAIVATIAEALEFGTSTAGRKHNQVIAPRPAWGPAILSLESQLTQIGASALVRAGPGR